MSPVRGVVAGVAQASLDDGLNALRRKDFATAVKELRPLAERGDAEAQYRVGLLYEYGKGYTQDKTQGIAWFTKAANQGHTAAQQELGVIYTTGDGVAKDDAKPAVAGIQWSIDAAKDFKVEKMSGDVKPGGVLTGKLAGSRGKTSWNLDFDVTLPAKSAAAGLRCGQ